jgi:hypothetical protein
MAVTIGVGDFPRTVMAAHTFPMRFACIGCFSSQPFRLSETDLALLCNVILEF